MQAAATKAATACCSPQNKERDNTRCGGRKEKCYIFFHTTYKALVMSHLSRALAGAFVRRGAEGKKSFFSHRLDDGTFRIPNFYHP
jgi:hypothetical protein